jgi:hypothetical protein
MALTVQDLMTKELLQEDTDDNELVQILEFMRFNGVPLTSNQAKSFYILKQNGLDDLADYVFNVRQHMTPTKKYYELVNKVTLADRIKGNAKLSNILKANNPVGGAMLNTGIRPDGSTR